MSDIHICTLFEGHYQYGLGALTNTLYACGFVGTIWVGYRGELPDWTKQHSKVGENTYLVADKIKLAFIKLETKTHFTLYKPDFMLHLIESHCPDAKFLFYFDPDILIKTQWDYFERWAGFGVALCEDVSSPLSETSPLRCAWKAYFANQGIALCAKDDIYVNGGFVGVATQNYSFLSEWKSIQVLIKPDLPLIDNLHTFDRSNIFLKLDQDALNIAKDLTKLPVSIANKESMDFSPGGFVMSHAIGRPKPWEKNFFKHLIVTGNRPSKADRLYMNSSRFPIDLYCSKRVNYLMKYLNLKMSIVVSRFIAN